MCSRASSCLGSHETRAPRAHAPEWKAECNELIESLTRNFAGRVNFQNRQVDLMSSIAASATFLSVPAFAFGVDARWETQNRTVWNEKEHKVEVHELVYEISWIAELGAWRRFLRSQRNVQN